MIIHFDIVQALHLTHFSRLLVYAVCVGGGGGMFYYPKFRIQKIILTKMRKIFDIFVSSKITGIHEFTLKFNYDYVRNFIICVASC